MLLILGPEKQIEICRQPSGNRFNERIIQGPGTRVISAAVPQFSVDLDKLFNH